MNSTVQPSISKVSSAATVLIRIAVGLIFGTQGILKFIDPNMGVNRFARIGFPHPWLLAHVVGVFEIVCGFLVLVGLFTRLAAVPLLVIISTAIASTKIPELSRPGQGFWFMVSDARTDFAMACCLIFLIISGGGMIATDGLRKYRSRTPTSELSSPAQPGAAGPA